MNRWYRKLPSPDPGGEDPSPGETGGVRLPGHTPQRVNSREASAFPSESIP